MHRRSLRTTLPVIALAAATTLTLSSAGPAAASPTVKAEGRFAIAGPAYTYNLAVVPEGATARLRVVEIGGERTLAVLIVRGLPANDTYAVHAHTGPCSADPMSSEGHYQHQVGGPVDAVNELWLGFTSNAAGVGVAHAVVDWEFRDDDSSESITFHHGGPARVACLPADF
jgi:Cu-Zn family superoxide dismutase